MPRSNYQIHCNDEPLDPPEVFDNFAEAVTHMRMIYNNHSNGWFVLTPIVNSQFTVYRFGDDADNGDTYEIVSIHEGDLDG